MFFFLLSTVNLHHVSKVQCSVTMLPISQSLMLSHSQLDILKKQLLKSSLKHFCFFKKDQILEELVAHRGAPAVHGQASAAEETLSSSTGGERRITQKYSHSQSRTVARILRLNDL